MITDNLIFFIINNTEKFLALGLLTSTSFYFRILLQLFGQAWIRTKAHTATLFILPIITYVITNVISGNIALSLGMVGALSIVRFRNPVRSPLELSTYFAAITMGIAASVSLIWVIFLVFAITVATFLMLFINLVTKQLLKEPFFITSFTEGNSLSTLSVTTNETIEILETSSCLVSKVKSDNIMTYNLASSNFDKLKSLDSSSEILKKASTIELRR